MVSESLDTFYCYRKRVKVLMECLRDVLVRDSMSVNTSAVLVKPLEVFWVAGVIWQRLRITLISRRFPMWSLLHRVS